MNVLVIRMLPLLVLLAGCATTQRVDWDSRLGNFTYEQAVNELGQPENSTTLPDRSRVAEWLKRRGSSGAVGLGAGGAFDTPGVTGRRIPREAPAIPSEYLRLTFAPDGKLSAWKRVNR